MEVGKINCRMSVGWTLVRLTVAMGDGYIVSFETSFEYSIIVNVSEKHFNY